MPARRPFDERLQPVEPVEVEVVGRLVEQEDVVAAEQQRRQARAGRLAAGQRGHRLVEVDAEAQVGGDRAGPVVQVRAAEGEPALERDGVRVVGAGRARSQRLGGRVQPRCAAATPVRRARNSPHGLARRAAPAPAAGSRPWRPAG